MLGLEMLPLHPPQSQQQTPQIPLHLNHHPQQSVKQHGHLFTPKAKQQPQPQPSPPSDDEELGGFGPDDGKRRVSPWQRMKWTDGMVRLLIMAVFYIGDEATGSEGNNDKKKGGGGALLQKKGKWKSVSMAMMEKGFCVSPQQCEDKFNDLNKRYKRVNEILGKGTACRVVENQSLLDAMDLSPKMKEEVKKLLNSKHLFFREMCAYHSSCGHGGGGGANHSTEVANEPSQLQHQQQRCSHSSENAQTRANSSRNEAERSKIVRVGSEEDDDVEEEEDDSDDEDDDYDDDDAIEENSRGQNGHGPGEEDEEKPPRKRPRTPLMQQLSCEMSSVIQDSAKSTWEKKQWMKFRLVKLEEQRVGFQFRAFELEKQRLKWVKFSSKKEREMERSKMENERRRLENERMVLVLRQKELELIDLLHHHHPQQQQQQHSSTKRSDPSSITG